MPKISIIKLSDIYSSQIVNYYSKYFEHLYPRIEFRFSSYPNFKKTRNNISLYIFDSLRNNELETSEIVSNLKKYILGEEKRSKFPIQLTKKERNMLSEIATCYEDRFFKYFSDLVEIIKELIISTRVHQKIDAILIIKPIVKSFKKKNIDLYEPYETFYRSVREIYDFLKQNFNDFFPTRYKTQDKLPKDEILKREQDYRRIVGSKIKLYVIKNIYNGLYWKTGRIGKCPECAKEGFLINTNILRLKAEQFHHPIDIKENIYSAYAMFLFFSQNSSNPHFLEDLVEQMESEKVILTCGSHHESFHDDYFNHFKYLIGWKDIFSLSAEAINILIITSINNFRVTKELSKNEKLNIRRSIKKKLRKRYIIEYFYGEKCHICGEFNTREHLPSFEFNHLDKKKKKMNFSDLYERPCSEIVRIIEKEGGGGYICSNCHSVLHFDKYIHLLEKIYDDKSIRKKVFEDYIQVSKSFTPIDTKELKIKDPLKKSDKITENFEKLLMAIYDISEIGIDVTNIGLEDNTGISRISINKFFKKYDFLKKYINIVVGRGGRGSIPTKYFLTDEGKKLVKILNHFKDYYCSL